MIGWVHVTKSVDLLHAVYMYIEPSASVSTRVKNRRKKPSTYTAAGSRYATLGPPLKMIGEFKLGGKTLMLSIGVDASGVWTSRETTGTSATQMQHTVIANIALFKESMLHKFVDHVAAGVTYSARSNNHELFSTR